MCQYIEGSSASRAVVLPTQGGTAHSGNEWSDGEDPEELFVSPFMEEAKKEFERFENCNRS
jgi:hypothetical protein